MTLRRSLRTMMRAGRKPAVPAARPDYADETAALLFEVRRRGLDARTILDVGAFDGRWSSLAAGPYPSARFFLIEPQVEMKTSLDAFCERHPGSRWFQAAAGPSIGEVLLTICDGHRGSSVLPGLSPDASMGRHQRLVQMLTIDSLLEGSAIVRPDLVKLDVQGFELEALKGAGRLFGHTELFIVETSFFRFWPGMPLFHEVIAFMAERGYPVYDFAGWLRRPHDGALGQADVCFAREGGILRGSDRWA